MHLRQTWTTVMALTAVCCFVELVHAQPSRPPRVDFELITDPGFSVTGQQKWLKFIQKLDVDGVRIRSGRGSSQPEVREYGTKERPAYLVRGILTASDQLVLPGGKFRYGDSKSLNDWLEKLRDGGEETLYDEKLVFGLTAKQLVEVHEQLAPPLEFSTSGKGLSDVVEAIERQIKLPLVIDLPARRLLREQPAVQDELQGMSSGSALAAAIRPHGLVFAPNKPSGRPIRLLLTDVRRLEKSWPIGWPSKKSPGNTLPKLFEKLDVEIVDIPLEQSVSAIQKRLEVPVLYDWNSLARQRVDIEQSRVSVPPGNTYYKKILDTMLMQVDLRSEIRVDEADRPFVWISGKPNLRRP